MFSQKSQFGVSFTLGEKVKRNLRQQIDRRLSAALRSLAKQTRINYRGILRRLDRWLDHTGRDLDDAAVAAYLWRLFDQKGFAPRSIEQVLAAVRFRARALSQTAPTGTEVEMMRRRIRRKGAGRGKGPAKGLTLEQVETMIQTAESAPIGRGLRDAALMSVMFYCGLRAGEAGVLRVEDFTFHADGTGVVRIRRSKTDQAGIGATLPVPEPAVRRVEAWLVAAQISQGAVFRGVRSAWDGTPAVFGRDEGIKPWSVTGIVSQWAKRCGFKGVTSHSLRRSFAQHMTRAGCSVQEVARAGRWTNLSQVLRYVENEQASQSVVLEVFGSKGKGRRLRSVKSA